MTLMDLLIVVVVIALALKLLKLLFNPWVWVTIIGVVYLLHK